MTHDVEPHGGGVSLQRRASVDCSSLNRCSRIGFNATNLRRTGPVCVTDLDVNSSCTANIVGHLFVAFFVYEVFLFMSFDGDVALLRK